MFAQITALVIFIAMFIFIVMDKIERHIVTLIAGLLTCVLVFVVGGLEITGILEMIAGFIEDISGGEPLLIVVIILWVSAIASAIVDNIPVAATMIPVIRSLAAATGFDLGVFAWTLAMGTDLGGSAPPIGASANVVGVAQANKSGHKIGWGKYCKAMIPVTLLSVLISMVMLYLKYFA